MAPMNDEEEVRRRAYERYIARGGGDGAETEDWLVAEREVREMRERDAARPRTPSTRSSSSEELRE